MLDDDLQELKSGPRTLTDADLEGIAEALENRMVRRFYGNVGRGVWGLAWKAIVLGLVALAAYGAFRNGVHGQ